MLNFERAALDDSPRAPDRRRRQTEFAPLFVLGALHHPPVQPSMDAHPSGINGGGAGIGPRCCSPWREDAAHQGDAPVSATFATTSW